MVKKVVGILWLCCILRVPKKRERDGDKFWLHITCKMHGIFMHQICAMYGALYGPKYQGNKGAEGGFVCTAAYTCILPTYTRIFLAKVVDIGKVR